jgi:glutamine synthetase
MCYCYTPAGEPISTNKTYNAARIFSNPEVAAEDLSPGIQFSLQIFYTMKS